MRRGPWTGIVRVTHSRESIEEATQLAIERAREGYSHEALVLAVDEKLNNPALSRAIALYATASLNQGEDFETFYSLAGLPAIFFSGLVIWGAIEMLHLVAADTNILIAILIVAGQATLFRLAIGGFRYAVYAICDRLNEGTYPTTLHRISGRQFVGGLRLRRLRALVAETADRLVAGESAPTLSRELAQLNVTPRAAAMVVRVARINSIVRDYVPPYESRWMAYTLAITFLVTCMIVITRAGGKLAEGYQNYALAMSGWIAGDLAARPRRRQLPPSSPNDPA